MSMNVQTILDGLSTEAQILLEKHFIQQFIAEIYDMYQPKPGSRPPVEAPSE
jgi:hypothetical protein